MSIEEAAKRLVDGFSAVPERWVKVVADSEGDEFNGVMWGTMFIVNDSVDKRRIESLLKDEDEDSEMMGSFKVGDTGINAWWIDGELVLGINGAGYDFYEAHWIPLYKALDYHWHK